MRFQNKVLLRWKDETPLMRVASWKAHQTFRLGCSVSQSVGQTVRSQEDLQEFCQYNLTLIQSL